MNKNKLVLIGAGNIAYHLAPALQKKGIEIIQIYNRTLSSAKELGAILGVSHITDTIQNITPDADIYLFCIKDDVLPELLKNFPTNDGLFIHTAGSLPMNVFEPYAKNFGVLYPLQTFSKQRSVFFGNIPFFIEGNTPANTSQIETIAQLLSFQVNILSSEKRERLHLAAVFANNFSNHLFDIAAQMAKEQGLDWRLLVPIIEETADKLRTLSPREAQTGPAVRYDEKIIQKHLNLLKDKPEWQELYKLLSEEIHRNGEWRMENGE